MCRLLGVSRSGFDAWERRAPSERALHDVWLVERIRAIQARSRETCGSPRVHAELRRQGVRVGRKRAERLMRTAGISGSHRRRKGTTTIRVQGVRVVGDLVDRTFVAAAPNRLSMSDIKEIPSWEGKLYLATVIDCFSRRVVGWSMREHINRERLHSTLGYRSPAEFENDHEKSDCADGTNQKIFIGEQARAA
jgi:putative transposase